MHNEVARVDVLRAAEEWEEIVDFLEVVVMEGEKPAGRATPPPIPPEALRQRRG